MLSLVNVTTTTKPSTENAPLKNSLLEDGSISLQVKSISPSKQVGPFELSKGRNVTFYKSTIDSDWKAMYEIEETNSKIIIEQIRCRGGWKVEDLNDLGCWKKIKCKSPNDYIFPIIGEQPETNVIYIGKRLNGGCGNLYITRYDCCNNCCN